MTVWLYGLVVASGCVMLPAYLRFTMKYRHNPLLLTVGRIDVLVTISLFFYFPPLAQWTNERLHVPNSAMYLANLLTLTASTEFLRYYLSVRDGYDQTIPRIRTRYGVLAVLSVIMFVFLLHTGTTVSLQGSDRYHVNSALIAYRLVYYAYMLAVIVRLLHLWGEQSRIGPQIVRVSFRAIRTGGICEVVYLTLYLLMAIAPETWRGTSWLQGMTAFVFSLMMLSYTVSMALLLLPRFVLPRLLWVQQPVVHMQHLMQYRQLTPLWTAIVAAFPSSAPPSHISWWSMLWHPAEMTRLLDRRMIDILDGWQTVDQMQQHRTTEPIVAVPGVQSEVANEEERHWFALVDAFQSSYSLTMLQQHEQRASLLFLPFPLPLYRPEQYEQQIAYLTLVARQFVALQHLTPGHH